MSKAKEKETTFKVDENGNIYGLLRCKKAFFAFLEGDGVYDKIFWPKSSHTASINEANGQITFKTDSHLRIVCGDPEEQARLNCPKGYTAVWNGTEWICVRI